jgi:hypothetical protein
MNAFVNFTVNASVSSVPKRSYEVKTNLKVPSSSFVVHLVVILLPTPRKSIALLVEGFEQLDYWVI